MTPIEVLTGLTVIFVFGYLVWALLRPEDF
jgi:K+-transporting ATPase KdpF subunit